MTGQDAVNSAKVFNEALELDGVIMTKLDGDARGGAALSVKQVTGVPIKFIGTGEHLDALEEFHPDRMAGRILGQGDILTLVEKAQQEFDQEEMRRQEERLAQGRVHARRLPQAALADRPARPAAKSDGHDPRHGQLNEMMGDVDPEEDMKRLFGIIDSMTPDERRNPSKIIDQSRRRRIAAGAGVRAARSERPGQAVRRDGPDDDLDGRQRHARADEDGPRAANRPDAKPERPGAQKVGTGKRLSNAERAKLKKEREKEMRRRKREQKRGPAS